MFCVPAPIHQRRLKLSAFSWSVIINHPLRFKFNYRLHLPISCHVFNVQSQFTSNIFVHIFIFLNFFPYSIPFSSPHIYSFAKINNSLFLFSIFQLFWKKNRKNICQIFDILNKKIAIKINPTTFLPSEIFLNFFHTLPSIFYHHHLFYFYLIIPAVCPLPMASLILAPDS